MGGLALVSSHSSTLPDVSVGHVLVQSVLALVFIVGGIWAVGKIYARRRSGGMMRRGGASSHGLSIISRQALGKDQQLAVVQWGERKILVGISGSNITFFNDSPASDEASSEGLGQEPSFGEQPEFAGNLLTPARSSISSMLPFGNIAPKRQDTLLERLRNATQRN